MHIVVIAWLFVAALMAMTLSSAVAGLVWFAVVGVLPVALLVWMTARPRAPRADRSDR